MLTNFGGVISVFSDTTLKLPKYGVIEIFLSKLSVISIFSTVQSPVFKLPVIDSFAW
ncbi:hypothetical protein [uncultured Clostridium sp.]|uniref:hypothetical protein n=1 Tax=uncultured Clostridium sp. TaxID=59620 RepID=UPI0025873181|nr:hypothetical protein [uncultured Clostridium sp.]